MKCSATRAPVRMQVTLVDGTGYLGTYVGGYVPETFSTVRSNAGGTYPKYLGTSLV